MYTARARVHLHSCQDSRQNGCRDPDAQVRGNVTDRIWNPMSLGSRSQNRENASRSECRGTVTTKLRSTGHLSANTADVAKRFIEIVHGQATLQCKVKQQEKFVSRCE